MAMMSASRGVVFVCAALVVPLGGALACTPLQATPAYPAKNATTEGHDYCSKLSISAARRSSDLHGLGWAVAVAGGGALVSGVVFPETGGSDNEKNRVAGPILVVGGLALAALGAHILASGDRASQVAARAEEAMKDSDDRTAYAQCVDAKAIYFGATPSGKSAVASAEKSTKPEETKTPVITGSFTFGQNGTGSVFIQSAYPSASTTDGKSTPSPSVSGSGSTSGSANAGTDPSAPPKPPPPKGSK